MPKNKTQHINQRCPQEGVLIGYIPCLVVAFFHTAMEGISNAVDMAIFSHKQWQHIKHGLNFYKWIKGLMP